MNKYLRYILDKLPAKIRIMCDMVDYYLLLRKYNASIKTDNDCQKMQYTLLRETHVIEKGLSMRRPKYGFGKQKVRDLIGRLGRYIDRYYSVDRSFIDYPLSVIKHYISFMNDQKVDIEDIKDLFGAIVARCIEPNLEIESGVNIRTKQYIQEQCRCSFKELLDNRHSIRYFKSERPADSLIISALELAQKTPSACNRQAWHTHVYRGESCAKLLNMQGGCNGFSDEIPCAIVVTADLKGFLEYEPFQCYIDGGLYAMNLINALHYLGLGTIPLSCGFHQNKLSNIKSQFDIPDNEVLILIIGLGYLEDSFKVAVSTRKHINTTNIIHY